MTTIRRDELKTRLDRGEPLRLVMTMDRLAYEKAHIPGSISLASPIEAAGKLDRDEPVVLYCTNTWCYMSHTAYRVLRAKGFKNVYRYSGGLEDWQAAGYPLEGSYVA